MSLAVSYDHTTGVAKLIRDCQHVETQDIGPNLMFEIERLYIGRVNEVGGVNTHCKWKLLTFVRFIRV